MDLLPHTYRNTCGRALRLTGPGGHLDVDLLSFSWPERQRAARAWTQKKEHAPLSRRSASCTIHTARTQTPHTTNTTHTTPRRQLDHRLSAASKGQERTVGGCGSLEQCPVLGHLVFGFLRVAKRVRVQGLPGVWSGRGAGSVGAEGGGEVAPDRGRAVCHSGWCLKHPQT